MMERQTRRLYHGTLAQNTESIRIAGLSPKKGLLAEKFSRQAGEFIYAVDDDRKGRLTAIIAGQIAINGLVQWSENYQFENFNSDLIAHGAVIVFRASTFCCRERFEEPGHPPSIEVGDWYSRESVSNKNIERVIIGKELLDWLDPHEKDFTCRYRDRLRALCADRASRRSCDDPCY
jgi:hypothetical protein